MKGKQKKLLLLAYLFIACLLVAIAISAVSAAKFSKASFSDLKSTKYMPFPEEWKKARWEIRNCPRISSIADIEISEGEPASFSISASDPNGNPLSYRVSESYSNVEFSQSGNAFSWQTEEGDAETYTITAYASDGSCEKSKSFMLIVLEVEQEIRILVVETSSSGVDDIVEILEDKGYIVDLLAPGEIASGISSEYSAMVYPGGMDGVYAVFNVAGLSSSIRDFVSNGGGYIGICGGSVVGSSYLQYDSYPQLSMVGLLDITAQEHSDWADHYVGSSEVLDFQFETEHEILGTYEEGDILGITYAGGPIFQDIGSDISILASFNENLDSSLDNYNIAGEPAVVIGQYGSGKVFLTSPHPEYRSDNEFLLLNAVGWVTS